MSKKLRVLMLSVIAVLFAASSAFAVLSADDTLTLATDEEGTYYTENFTEGYNYVQRVYVDSADLIGKLDSVTWDVYADNASDDVSWLTWSANSFDVILEGRLPAYSEDKSTYIIHVVAYTSQDIVSDDDAGTVVTTTISADINDSGLEITVEAGSVPIASKDIAIFSDLVSVDYASSDRGLSKATSNYSVTVNFLTTTQQIYQAELDADENPTGVYNLTSAEGDIFVNAQLTSDDDLPGKINLPSWLKYKVLSATYDLVSGDEGYTSEDTTPYVRSLRIFYSSDRTPATNAPGAVYITTVPSSTPVSKDKDEYAEGTTYETKYEAYSGEIIMGWNVDYYTIPAISVDLASYDITVKYGTSADIGVSGDTPIYFYKQAPVSITFSPDISADVAITASWDVISSDTDNAYGKITLNVEPLTPLITTYSTDMIIKDSYDNTAAIMLYINVSMDAMFISPDTSASVNVDVGASKDVSFIAYNFNGSVKSWDLGTIPSGITVTPVTGLANATKYNERIVYTVAGVTEGRYSFDITAVDSSDRSADITVSVTVSPRPVPPAPGVSFSISPASTTVTVAAGASKDVSFTASNNSGDVTWTLGTVPSGVTVAPSASAYATQGNTRMVYTVTGVTAGASGSVTVTATDAAGRTSNATMSITVTDSSTSFSISASRSSVTVEEGSTANVTLTATGNSGLVTWTLGSQPSGALVTPTASQTGTSAAYTVAGVTAGSSSSFTVTATDAAGNTDSETISVTVTSGDTPVPGREAGNTPAGSLSDATKAAVAILVGNGMLVNNGTDGGTLPERAVQYPVVNSSYVTLSRTGTTNITKSSDINPIDLVLSFDVDIWRIYINNSIVAWAYSPGVTPAEFDGKNDFSASAGNHSGSGIEILPQSASEAQINFTAADMPTGNNVIASAFVLDIASPDQEIGKTTIATVNVSSGSPSSDEEYGVGSSSGGCSAGLGAIVSALAAAFFISKKRS